jgi:hypothetical protein
LCEFTVWRRFCASLRYGGVFVRVYGIKAFLSASYFFSKKFDFLNFSM